MPHEEIHVEVAVLLKPVFMGLDARARMSRRQLATLGKILTTRVRRLISSFSLSRMLVLFKCL